MTPPHTTHPPSSKPIQTIRNLTGQHITLLLPDFTYMELPSEGEVYIHRTHAKPHSHLPVPAFALSPSPIIHDLPHRVANTSIIVSAEVFWTVRRPDLYTPAIGPFDGVIDAQPWQPRPVITRLIGPYRMVAENDDDSAA